ncbi:MAG: hypothetical protein QXU26_01340 [Thermofilaceae archaeon]
MSRLRSKANIGEVSVTVRRDADGVKLTISLPDGKSVELSLPFEEARKLGKLLLSHADSGILQVDLFLRKLSDIERSVARLDERVRELESRIREKEG